MMESKLNVHVAFAHDAEWMKSGTDEVLMSLLDEDMKHAAETRLPYDEVV